MWRIPKLRYVIGLVIVALVATACSSSDGTDVAASTSARAAERSVEPTPTAMAEPTASPTAPATADPETAVADGPAVDEAGVEESEPGGEREPASEAAGVTTIPQSDDPCVTPADHVVDGSVGERGFVEYSFVFDGIDRPVGVRVFGQEALTADPVVWVSLHGEPFSWRIAANVTNGGFQAMLGPTVNHVVFAPQAQPGDVGFWTESETFNVEFLQAFMTEVGGSVCLDNATVIALGLAEGAFAIAQAMCTIDLGLDMAVLISGLVATDGCSPPAAVPIMSFDLFDQVPEVGKYWGGEWNPPGLAFELSGPVGPTVAELDTWSELYNCAEPAVEEDVPSGDVYRSEALVTEALINRSCDATLVAFGMLSDGPDSGGSFGAAFADVWPRVQVELQLALDA